MALQAIREADGSVAIVGDLVTSFRGEQAILKSITRERIPGKSGKVCVVWVEDLVERDHAPALEYYDGVFDLKVVDTDRVPCPRCNGIFAKVKGCKDSHHD